MENQTKHPVEQIAEAVGGKIETMGSLPDGSGFATVSFPLPKEHWIYGDKSREGKYGFEPPPMVFRMGTAQEITIGVGSPTTSRPFPSESLTKKEMAEKIRIAARYAVRASTMKGKEMDFDPDALLQNLIVGILGYWTDDGLDHDDDWANPQTTLAK